MILIFIACNILQILEATRDHKLHSTKMSVHSSVRRAAIHITQQTRNASPNRVHSSASWLFLFLADSLPAPRLYDSAVL